MRWQVGKCTGRGGSEKLARRERCEGRGGGGLGRSWQGGDGARVVSWQGGKSGREVKWQGGMFPTLFKSRGHMVSLRFHFLVSDVDQQQNKGAR